MSAENDFFPFAVGESANVLTQAEYAAETGLLQNGFSAGIAPSVQLNKVWRQSSIMAAVIAQFIAERTGENVIDDGTTTTILENLLASAAALNGDSTQTFSVGPATQSQQAVQLGQSFGLGQTWQNVAASRALNTVYTNATGRPIFVTISAQSTSGVGTLQCTVNGAAINGSTAPSVSTTSSAAFVVPPGGTYSAAPFSGNSLTLSLWAELR